MKAAQSFFFVILHRHQVGASLIELLCVMLVVSILIGSCCTYVSSSWSAVRLRVAVSHLLALLRQARQLAVSQGAPIVVFGARDNKGYGNHTHFEQFVSENKLGKVVDRFTIPQGVEINCSSRIFQQGLHYNRYGFSPAQQGRCFLSLPSSMMKARQVVFSANGRARLHHSY